MSEPAKLWEPTAAAKERCELSRYARWLRETRGLGFDEFAALWSWSVTDLSGFWQSIWDYVQIKARDPAAVALADGKMPGAKWFPGATLNYAEHALARRDEKEAILYRREDGVTRSMTYAELHELVVLVRGALQSLGVAKGDRVCGFVSNTPETVAVFLAVASLGAIWSSCAPEFGVASVLDRFRQVEPKVLVGCDGYPYAGKLHDRRAALGQIAASLSSIKATVALPSVLGGSFSSEVTPWDRFLESGRANAPGGGEGVSFEHVPFDHPLWILYSSGTTGLPKAIVQGHGGILLEHWKALALHCDIGESDRFFWFTTTGWMMWNFLVGGLLRGATILLYDGSPAYPNLTALWRFAEESKMTVFGTSAPYLLACRKASLVPSHFDLTALRHIGSTGAPLPSEGFDWVYESVKSDLQLGSMSGGTDVCTAFVLANPWLPVYSGEIQCRGLGCKVEAFDSSGHGVVGEVGELVLTEPMPSMPLFLWGDSDGTRMRESYFEPWPGVWRHGDWIEITSRGGCVIYGRSDATLNRGGVRMGTSELYRVVEAIPEIADSLVVDTGALGQEDKLWLFVVVQSGELALEPIKRKLVATIREKLSPRHVPDQVVFVPEIPRTINGKKMEVPVKRLLMGTPVAEALNRDTMANAKAIEPFLALVASFKPRD